MKIPVTYIEKKDVTVEVAPITLIKYLDDYITNSFNMPEGAFITNVNSKLCWVRGVYGSHDYDEFVQSATAEEIKVMEALKIVRSYIHSKRELPVCT